MTTAVIIEDEVHAASLLQRYLEKYCETKVLGIATSVTTGVELVLDTHPEILFLDISLPDYDGFELLRRLQPASFEVILVTAFNQYAIQAIRMSAVDYLLKPVDIGELRQAVARAKDRIRDARDKMNLTVLLDNLSRHPVAKRIAIPDGHAYVYEDICNIIRLRAQGRYTEIYTSPGKKYTVTRNLGEFDKLLSQYDFLRVHHSHLVNPDYIISYEKQDGGLLVMKDKSIVEVSRRNREILLKYLKEK